MRVTNGGESGFMGPMGPQTLCYPGPQYGSHWPWVTYTPLGAEYVSVQLRDAILSATVTPLFGVLVALFYFYSVQ